MLYAINSSLGRGVQANLITIDPQTGKVTNLGALPNDTSRSGSAACVEHKDMLEGLLEWRMPLMITLLVFAVVMRRRPGDRRPKSQR